MVWFYFISGIGFTLSHVTSHSAVAQTFNKWHGLISGIVNCGASVGILVIPQILAFVLNQFDLFGAILLYGVIQAHIIAGSAVFYLKRQKDLTNVNTVSSVCHDRQPTTTAVSCVSQAVSSSVSSVSHVISSPHSHNNTYQGTSISLTREDNNRTNIDMTKTLSTKKQLKEIQMTVISHNKSLTNERPGIHESEFPNKEIHIRPTSIPHHKVTNSYIKDKDPLLVNKFSSILRNNFACSLLKNVPYAIMLVSGTLAANGLLMLSSFAPARGREIGLSNSDISMLLTLSAVLDLTIRLIVGTLASKTKLHPSFILSMFLIGSGTMVISCAWISSYVAVAVLLAISMPCGSTLFVLQPVVFKLLLPKDFPRALSLSSFTVNFMAFFCFFLMGKY